MQGFGVVYRKSQKTRIYITTNGALAQPDRIRYLAELGLNSIKYSVNASTRETYKKIHGKDDFETVRNNIIELCKNRRNWEICG